MGITDFGQTSGGTVSYNTSSFEGSAAIHSLVVCASSSPCGSTQLGFQLNTVLGFEDGGNWYVYWIQDVMVVDTGSKSVIAFEDNIWNLSGYGTTMYYVDCQRIRRSPEWGLLCRRCRDSVRSLCLSRDL